MGERLWYRIREVAEMLGYSESKVKALVRAGTMKSIKEGKSRRVSREQLDEWRSRV